MREAVAPKITTQAELAPYSQRQLIGLFLGPALFLLAFFLIRPAGMDPKATAVLASTIWIATWWVTEAIPIPVTSLLPVILFPVLGVSAAGAVTARYMDPIIFLFLGGFLIALAIERWNLHKRIALGIISAVGVSPVRLVLGFMAATAVLSAGISNTATAMMMLPIGLAVISQVVALHKAKNPGAQAEAGENKSNFGTSLMLGIAYAASIGGLATLIGSPPNAVFAGVVTKTLGIQVGFAQWMIIGVPVAVVFLFITWAVLIKMLPSEVKDIPGGRELIQGQIRELGPISPQEMRVLILFAVVAVSWFIRPFVLTKYIPFLDDSVIAVVGGLALFLIPGDRKRDRFLLDAGAITRLPWGILLLFGSGFALASAFQSSGLAAYMAEQLKGLQGVGYLWVLVAVTSLTIFLTEVTSNTAIATLLMPIMGALGLALGVAPIGLMMTAAMAASFAFMLPVATPPNAIVFGSGYLTISQMARVGFYLNILGIAVITIASYYLVPLIWQ